MANTDKLHDAKREAADAEADIKAACADLLDQLRAKVAAFCTLHDADFNHADGYLTDMVSDIEFDAVGPHYRRRVSIEDQIAAIEDRDLRRNGPVRV